MSRERKKFYLICGILVVIFLLSLINILRIVNEYDEEELFYRDTREAFTEPAEENGPPIQVNMKKLRKINDDVVGWICMEDTTVDYPILQGENNKYYLDKTYYKKYMPSGSIFMDWKNAEDFSDKHTIIYGHNMKNHAMFGDLSDFSKEKYLKKHPYIWVILPDGGWLKYEIYSVYRANINDGTFKRPVNKMENFNAFLKVTLKKNKFRDMDSLPVPHENSQSRILTLSTCTEDSADTARFVVHGILVKEKQGK